MKIYIEDNYQDLSRRAFEELKKVLDENPNCVLGLATGSSPMGLYAEMVKDYKENGTSYKGVKTVNLDEYVGKGANDKESYVTFMRENLFDHVDIDIKNTDLPNGMATDLKAECDRYNKLLEERVPDLQVLGIGSNGHIGFNEPGTSFNSVTHVVDLTENTIKDNSRLFASPDLVPRQALSMGIKNIMNSKKILLVANGVNKAKAIKAMLDGEVTEDVPASVLQNHENVVVVLDKDAASLL